jgi:UPF0755 protein
MATELQDPVESKSRWGIKKVIALVVFILFIFATGSGIGAYFYIQEQLKPVESSGKDVKVIIPQGSSAEKIGYILEDSELIRNAQLFKWYVRFRNNGNDFKAGTYMVQTGSSIDEMITMLRNGEVVRDTIKFTIPEGWNIVQIADRLAANGIVDRELFLKEVNEGQFNYEWLKDIPQREDVSYRLEGFLFPETYEVEKDSTEHEIINKMLAQFDKEWKPEWREQLKDRGISTYNAVILASIVEREVVVDKERPIVSGIFYNRINDGWPLQSCATVQFVLGKQRDRITYEDLEVESPYNTYINEGLPPGPIASPGRASLKAVVYPEKTDYFFFVTKKDGSQQHLFAKTFAEHQKNNANSRGSW